MVTPDLFAVANLVGSLYDTGMGEVYTVFHKKTTRYLIAHNFRKCWPIFKIFSLSDSAVIL